MGRAKFDDSYDDDAEKKPNLKGKRSFNRENLQDEAGASHRKKRSGVRAHRKKTHKDQFWEENQ